MLQATEGCPTTALSQHAPVFTINYLIQSLFISFLKLELRIVSFSALVVDDSANSKAIDKIWPVKRVTLQPRSELTVEQTGKASANADLFYLFELGAPLTLYRPIVNVPYASTRGSMKLTTLSAIEAATDFAAIAQVYGGI